MSDSPANSAGGVYQTTDGGATWNRISGLPTGNSILRGSLGISSSGNNLYVVMSDQNGNLINGDIYTGVNTGGSWTWSAHAVPANMASDNSESQWWYDIFAMVDPTISAGTTAYIGGVDLWKTTDGGVNWTNLTNAYTTGTVHPDQHALAFLPSSSSYYLGNDGGVWSGTSGGSFTDLNGGGLNINAVL